MRRSPVAAMLALAIAPATAGAEARVTVTGAAGAPVAAPATYSEPAATLQAALTGGTASVTVRQGAATKLTLRVGMPATARLAAGTFDVATGASIALTPNACGATPLAGTFTLHHAVPGVRQTAPTELYLTAAVRCGAAPAVTTIAVRLQRAKSRTAAKEAPKAFLPVIDGLSSAWSTASGQAVFAPFGGPRTRFAKKRQTYL